MHAWTKDDGDAAETDFTIDWPWLDASHVRAFVDGVELTQGAEDDFVVGDYDNATGETIVTFASAPGNGTDNVVIRRTTTIPTDLVDADGGKQVKRSVDTQHGSGLVMGDQPTNLELLFRLQEFEDRFEEVSTLAADVLTENSTAIGGSQDGNFATLAVAWNGSTDPTAAEGALLIDAIRECAAKINTMLTTLNTY